jgi:hypothetical protein
MPFADKLKKGIGSLLGHSSGPDKGTKDAKQSASGKDVASQEEALKPAENKKAEKRKDTRSLGAKVDDALGLGQHFRTKGWCQRKWKEVRDEMDFLKPEGMLAQHRTAFMAFLKKEYSTENGNALVALREGMDMKTFYERFISDASPEQINIPSLPKYHTLAAEGRHAEFDKEVIEKNLLANLSDSWSRAIFDPDLLKAMFQRMNNMVPPDKIDGGYDS